MLAVRWHGRQDVRLEEIDEPPRPGVGQLLLDVKAAGICGTDLHEWLSGPHTIPITPHPLSGRCAPITLGHEFVGTVRVAGPGTSFAAGTLVAVEVNSSCGECEACQAGRMQLCDLLSSHGLHDDGGLAERVLVPQAMCVDATGLTPLEAVLAEPLAVAVRTSRLLALPSASTVCVVGAGTVGQLTIRLLTLEGHRVFVVDPVLARIDLACRHGAESGSAPEDADSLRRTTTGERGFDAVIDTAGAPGAVLMAIRLTRKGGTVGLVGADHQPLAVSPLTLILAEQRLQAVLSHTMVDFRDAVDLLVTQGVSTEGLVTGTVPLADAISGAFEQLRDNASEHLKIVIVPDTGAIDRD